MLRALRWSTWLGWQIASSWTDPWLFFIYVLAKPLAGSLLLVCMVVAARAAGATTANLLPFAYFGNALYMLVGAVGFGMSGAVISDREHYGMLKYIRLSPVSLRTYLLGRGLAGGATGALGALFTLAAGFLLPLGLWQALPDGGVAWGWLLVYVALGVVMLLALGLILAGTVLNMARHGMFLSEGVGSILYLLSGAIFPVGELPPWLQAVSLALPPTYWMQGVRRALLGSHADHGPLAGWGFETLALAMLLGAAALTAVALVYFRWCERRAQRLGRFDVTTGY
jgi:ABC-2 type transport system permease protein